MQLNVDLPPGELKRVKKDAVEMGVTLNLYVLQACQQFLTKSVAQRRVFFDGKKAKKIYGRSISI